MRNLVYLPDVNENSFLLLTTRGEAARLRAYLGPDWCNVVPPNRTTTQVLRMLNHTDAIRLPADDVPHGRIDYWFDRVAVLNREYGLAGPPLSNAETREDGAASKPTRPPPRLDEAAVEPRPWTRPATDTLSALEARMRQLADAFTASPTDFFHEKELHTAFFPMCRVAFGEEAPRGAKTPVQLFRHEYDTLWRYRRSDGFANRYETEGTTACLDFALLDRGFVAGHDLYTVMNKSEPLRKRLRAAAGPSPALVVGVEFKMAIARSTAGVGVSGVTGLQEGMLADCRKLAWERIPIAYVLGFSHGPRPDSAEAERVAEACITEFRQYNPQGDPRILVVTPELRLQRGSWDVRV